MKRKALTVFKRLTAAIGGGKRRERVSPRKRPVMRRPVKTNTGIPFLYRGNPFRLFDGCPDDAG
jgi:hypothetical protein